MEDLIGNSKLFKAGNSFGLRITKKDKEYINANPGDEFEKEISPDGQTIIFRKKQEVSKETLDLINELFDENRKLMERLKDK